MQCSMGVADSWFKSVANSRFLARFLDAKRGFFLFRRLFHLLGAFALQYGICVCAV